MIAPILLTTTAHKETLRRRRERRREEGQIPEPTFVRIILDAYDIVRIAEVQKDVDDTDEPICRVSHVLEEADEQGNMLEIQYVNVRHSLDEVWEMIVAAKREKKEWEQ